MNNNHNMSYKTLTDWNFSDRVFSKDNTIKVLNLFYKDKETLEIIKATSTEDMHNNIDYYVNGDAVQWRVQRLENIKGNINDYGPTLRYSRESSLHEDRKESELKKIMNNKKKGLPYPKHHIWCIVDKKYDIIKLFIIDIDIFEDDFQKNKYELWDTKKGKKLNASTSGKKISLKENTDFSSEFIILREKYLLPNTVIFKY